MFSKEVQKSIQDELERGFLARDAGNEGRARVCARRAAGIALREYFRLSGQMTAGSQSAYDLLGLVQNLDRILPRIKESALYLRMAVDENHKLPVEVDLLKEAGGLAEELGKLI